MLPRFSDGLLTDLVTTLDSALVQRGIVNISILAEDIRRRNAHDNVALEDIACELVRRAQTRNVPMEFDGSSALS